MLCRFTSVAIENPKDLPLKTVPSGSTSTVIYTQNGYQYTALHPRRHPTGRITVAQPCRDANAQQVPGIWLAFLEPRKPTNGLLRLPEPAGLGSLPSWQLRSIWSLQPRVNHARPTQQIPSRIFQVEKSIMPKRLQWFYCCCDHICIIIKPEQTAYIVIMINCWID